jgi:hypothetical protein
VTRARWRMVASWLWLVPLLLASTSAMAGSVRFVANAPTRYDFVDIARLPASFGRSKFAFEMWVRPDNSFPVGPVWRSGYNQLSNWSDADPQPYSSEGWWLQGNWLLDGHTRPRGFGPGDGREGTFSLQFYGGGRLRFMFADTGENMPKGMVHAVQAWPASTTPSLLDGSWHHVVALRRWREPSGATLELWVDGKRVGATDIPLRTDMRRFWDKLAYPGDPEQLGGWSLGAEVMTAWNYAFTQYEDFKGLIDEVRLWGRAPSAEEIGEWARGGQAVDSTQLLAHFPFDERSGALLRDRLDPRNRWRLHRGTQRSWSAENAPVATVRAVK